jgi:GT2 family glycosyltransferase
MVAAKQAVTVVIPAYERAATLPRAIASVLDQELPDVEIVVVDDNSSRPIDVSSISADVRTIRLSENSGAAVARNRGAAVATNPILAFLDADDELAPASLRERLALLDTGTFATGRHVWVEDHTGRRGRGKPLDHPERWLPFENRISSSTFMVTASDFHALGGFPDADRDCAEDWVLALRALNVGMKIRWPAAPVAIIHRDGRNTTASHSTAIAHVRGALEVIENEQLVSARDLSRLRRVAAARIGGYEANAGNAGNAWSQFKSALAGRPDLRVVREATRVPVLGARGALRRLLERWRQWR